MNMQVWRVLTFSLPFVNLTAYLKDLAKVRRYVDFCSPTFNLNYHSSFLLYAIGSSCRFPPIKASELGFYL